jgi:hypothetical protein
MVQPLVAIRLDAHIADCFPLSARITIFTTSSWSCLPVGRVMAFIKDLHSSGLRLSRSLIGACFTSGLRAMIAHLMPFYQAHPTRNFSIHMSITSTWQARL